MRRMPGRLLVALCGLACAVVSSACTGWSPRAAPLPSPHAATAATALPASPIARAPVPDSLASGHEVLLFASDRAGNGDIFAAEPGRPPVNLTNHPAGDWDPTWSPSCANPAATCRIAFTSHRSGDSDIWVMDSYGRNLINVTQNPAWDYWPAWSPDGTRVAFISERDGDPELFIQPVDGGSATQLTFNNESDRLPAWSPDGTQIAFAAVRDDSEAIHLINVDGTHERPLTRWPLKATAPAWSPDGRQVAFVGWDEENRPGIYLLDIGAHTARLVWEGTDWIGSLDWSPAVGGGTTDTGCSIPPGVTATTSLYALSPDGGTPVRLTRNPAWDDFPELRTGLALHPDAWLAETAVRPGRRPPLRRRQGPERTNSPMAST